MIVNSKSVLSTMLISYHVGREWYNFLAHFFPFQWLQQTWFDIFVQSMLWNWGFMGRYSLLKKFSFPNQVGSLYDFERISNNTFPPFRIETNNLFLFFLRFILSFFLACWINGSCAPTFQISFTHLIVIRSYLEVRSITLIVFCCMLIY